MKRVLALLVIVGVVWVLSMDNDSMAAFLPLIILIVFYILPVVVNRKLAIQKGRSKIGWIIAVFWLSWWSTLILACLRSRLTQLEQSTLESKHQLKSDLEELK